jgi:hypothetical protein
MLKLATPVGCRAGYPAWLNHQRRAIDAACHMSVIMFIGVLESLEYTIIQRIVRFCCAILEAMVQQVIKGITEGSALHPMINRWKAVWKCVRKEASIFMVNGNMRE